MTKQHVSDRLESLLGRVVHINKKKIRNKQELEEKKAKLVSILEEIRAAGYDPKNLKTEMAKLESQIVIDLDAYEQAISVYEEALKAITGDNT